MLFRSRSIRNALVVASLAMVPAAVGQISGVLEVKVSDSSGAVVSAAPVTIRSIETGTSRSAVTDVLGATRFTQLTVGRYEVQVSSAGFNVFHGEAAVTSGGSTTVPVALEISGSQQQVTVTDSATPLNVANAQLQESTESPAIVTLPLVTGDVMALAAITPGVTPVAPRNPFLGLGSYNANGGRGRGNNITVDNATSTDIVTTGEAGLGTVPLDGIKEFNLITNNFNAEYGRNSSSQAQIITKSGTNEFHGRAFEFFRNDKLNARDYFDTTGQASILRDNDWGLVGGGALKKDKVFAFGTYEQQKRRGFGGTRVATVPTTDQVSGPIDPTSAALLKQLQVPVTDSGSLSNPAPDKLNLYAYSGRIDANLSQSDFLFFRAGTNQLETRSPSLTFLDSNLPTNGASALDRTTNATASETHVFSPRVVNQFLVSFGRSTPAFAPLSTAGGPEVLFADGTSRFGTWAGLPQGRVQNTFQYMDTVTYNRGSHNFKFGADVHRIQANSVYDANERGTLIFLSLDDFLAGDPFRYSQMYGSSVRGFRVWNESFFAQDDYRVTRHLTLNLGVRLEVAGGPNEVNGIFSNLNLNSSASLGGAGSGSLGAFDTGGNAFRTNHNWAPRFGFAWNPRGGRTVIRGGYGMAYDFLYFSPITNTRFMPPFMYNVTLPGGAMTGSNSYANVVAGTSAFQSQGAAAVGTFGTNITNFGSLSPVDQGLRNPQTQQWSLTVERELPWGMVGRASYVGTKSNYLQRSRPLNPLAPGLFTPPANLAEEASMQQSGLLDGLDFGLYARPSGTSNRLDPRFNDVTLVDSSANANYHSLQLHLARRFRSGYGFSASYTYSKSIDDVSDALGVLANDTSYQQNPNDNRNNRAVSAFDTPHRLVIVHQFQPQFTARISNPVLRTMFHGWMFAGIFQAQSGFPINLFSGSRAGLSDPSLLGSGADGGAVRPDLVGPVNLQFSPDPGLGSDNPDKTVGSGLAQPLVGHFGTLGRNVLRLNPLINADWSVGKDFRVTEKITTQFQAQFFNMFNNTTFSLPGNTLSAPETFGYYSDTDTNTRNITLALRLIW